MPPSELLNSLKGWSNYSGIDLNAGLISDSLGLFEELLTEICVKVPTYRYTGYDREVVLKKNSPQSLRNYADTSIKTGILLGLGNYAKTIILPNISGKIRIQKIHEIDPIQLIGVKGIYSADSSPIQSKLENFDVYFIASYHHTHVDIAKEALRSGSYAVIEKPLCISMDDFREFSKIAENYSQKYFLCFERRYSIFNEFIKPDLSNSGEPFSYDCIVFESPLELYHWYRWPNSGSRILSNGCHWIDHFMYLNGYKNVSNYTIRRSGSNDSFWVFMEMENGDTFSMSLRDRGSNRLGVRDYIEIKQGNKTHRIIDSQKYIAENNTKVTKRVKIRKIDNYQRMYRSISEKIANDEAGDSLASLKSSEFSILLDNS
jgi:predicted dehydrogenase